MGKTTILGISLGKLKFSYLNKELKQKDNQPFNKLKNTPKKYL